MKLRPRVRSTGSGSESAVSLTLSDSLKNFIEQSRGVVSSNSVDDCSVTAVGSRSSSVDSDAIGQILKSGRTPRERRCHWKRKANKAPRCEESPGSNVVALPKEKCRNPAKASSRSGKRSQPPSCSKKIVALKKSNGTHTRASKAMRKSSRARSALTNRRGLSADLSAYRELMLKMEAVDGPQLQIILERFDSKV